LVPVIVIIFLGLLIVMVLAAFHVSEESSRHDTVKEQDSKNKHVYVPTLNKDVSSSVLDKYGFREIEGKWYYTKYVSHDDLISFNIMIDLSKKCIDMNVLDELTFEDFPYLDKLESAPAGAQYEIQHISYNVMDELVHLEREGIITGYHVGDSI